MIKYFGIAILCAAATALLRETKSPLYWVLPASCAVCLFLCVSGSVRESVISLQKLVEDTMVADYMDTLLRAVGIGYASEMTADICRGCGAEQISSSILLLCRVELIILSLPLLTELMHSVLLLAA